MRRVTSGKLYLILASAETRGHCTTGRAKFWALQLQAFRATAPQRGQLARLSQRGRPV
jgi:homoserine O-acetyltransferase